MLHGNVGKFHRFRAGVRQAQLVQGVLEAHQAQAHRAMLQVGITRLGHGVEVNVDDVIEHAHGGVHGAFQARDVQLAVLDVGSQVHRAQVAHRNLIGAGVQGDLGTQVGAVHHALMLLRGAQIARVLEGDPGVTGLEQHGQHLAPQLFGRNFLEQLDLALLGQGFVMLIALAEGVAVQVVQVWHIAGGEQGPVAVFAHAFDQQIRHPVGGVHVVGTTALITGVLAQFQELFDVQVPAFQIGTDRALALAALVHGHGGVVDHFQERHHALALAIGTLDVGAQGPHRRPVVAQTTGPFGQQGVIANGPVDALQVVAHRGQIAGRQLGVPGAAVEQRGRAGHVIEAGQQLIEFDSAGVWVVLTQCQAHGHPHEEHLGQFQAGLVPVQEVTVVQGLQAQEAELEIALRFQGVAKAFQVKGCQGFVQQFVADTGVNKGAQGLWINLCQRKTAGQVQGFRCFQPELFQQQAGGYGTVVGFPFNATPGSHDQGRQHFGLFDAVVKVAQGVFHQRITVYAVQAGGGLFHLLLHQTQVQRGDAAIGFFHGQMRVRFHRLVHGALAGVFFTVQHVGPGHFLFFGPHQGQFHLVLDVFDVHLATGFEAAADGLHYLFGNPVHGVVDASGTGCLVPFHRQEGFGHRDTDLGRVETHQSAVSFDNLQGLGIGRGGRGFGNGSGCHGALLNSRWFRFTLANAVAHLAQNTGRPDQSAHP